MKTYKVGIIGATGTVGQRFVRLCANHPWFKISAVAASGRSAGKTYAEAVAGRWTGGELPQSVASLRVLDAVADIDEIVGCCDFVFSAVTLSKQETFELELSYAKRGLGVVSNNSAHRHTPDVPMVIPEINPEHLGVIEHFRKRVGTKSGFIAVKSNCSIQSYVPALHPLRHFGVSKVLACTYQAISGAGKTFEQWPEMVDNVIPYIGGEEDKSEREPLKVWGSIENGVICDAASPLITTQCIRVPVTDGHTAACFVSFDTRPTEDQILNCWSSFEGKAQQLKLPSAPSRFLHYFSEPDRPQARLDRDLENGMAVSIGRLRPDTLFDFKFVCLSHNTLRGAAGGAVLLAELLCAEGYIA